MKSNLILWSVTGMLVIAIAGVALYKSWPLLFPVVHISVPLDSECDLRAGPCVSPLPEGGRVSFAIEPRSIPVVKPLELQVRLEGMAVERVEIDFSGVDMNMGFNRPLLSKQGEGHFSGKGMLPVCVRDAMEWEARVLLHTDQGLVSAPYRFITVKPGMELSAE
ncbi:MAG: hypothetical protein QNJ78_07900 [Gammaproteobacteria bacterium]|nr:hypothetical protein [Gammaproteobacteria bacterium]